MARKRPPRKDYKLSPITKAIPRACVDEAAAVEFLEQMRWGTESGDLAVACPHCGAEGESYQMKDRKTGERNSRYLWRCRGCGKQHTVKVGTIMEGSHIAFQHWCFAFWRICAGKKGCSAMELHRMTGITYRSALYLLHRVRACMETGPDAPKLSGTVEADETVVGGRHRNMSAFRRRKARPKQAVLTAVERGGRVRARHVSRVTARVVERFLRDNIDLDSSRLDTDESKPYTVIGREFARGHRTVYHAADEFARGDVTINGAENFHSLLKRQLFGIHHAVSPAHLHRYVDEVAFRYSTREMDDGDRFQLAVQASQGRHLPYRKHVGRR